MAMDRDTGCGGRGDLIEERRSAAKRRGLARAQWVRLLLIMRSSYGS
jgi:hypothetical protein